jgi:hypothetical protein
VRTYTSNRFLSSLSPGSRDALLAHSTAVALPLRAMLYEAQVAPAYAYFMTSGMASVVTEMEDGETAEVGIIGNEGIVGTFHILGPAPVPTSSFIQLEGTALKIPLSDLKSAFRSSEDVRDLCAPVQN